MNNTINRVPYLRTSREFPEELHQLSVEVNRSYVDIAAAVNNRTIGLFPTSRPAINGESWFINPQNPTGFNSQRQQGLRQVYPFTATGTIPTGISFNSVNRFTKPSGSFTDGTNYYGAIYASNVAIAGQVTFYIVPSPVLNPTTFNIVIIAGGGAPAIQSGIIILEWISDV